MVTDPGRMGYPLDRYDPRHNAELGATDMATTPAPALTGGGVIPSLVPTPSDRFRNRLLAALPPEVADRLRPALTSEPLLQGQVLMEACDPIERIYFPEEGVVSAVCVFPDGTVTEMCATGCEGFVSVVAALGGTHALSRHVVQVPGKALSLDADLFRRMMDEEPGLRSVALSYAQAYIAQALQYVACNGIHNVDQRCARWLLMCHDRVKGDDFPLTQEFLADMLGVHRPTVSVAAKSLQTAGLIRYSRGLVTVLDRKGLEEMSCACYGMLRRQFERLLPHTYG
jgi:CRP-like cAMP-binding protein